MHNRPSEELEKDLIGNIEKARQVIDGLEGNASYQLLINDFKDTAEKIDSVWHLQFDMGKLNEMRITKMAALSIVNALDGYKYDLQRASEQLARLKEEE